MQRCRSLIPQKTDVKVMPIQGRSDGHNDEWKIDYKKENVCNTDPKLHRWKT